MASPDFARILAPTDFSPCSDEAIDFAKTLARKFGASLHVIHVLEDWPIREFAVTQRMMDALLTDEERTQLRATSTVLRGAVATTIVDYAAAHQIDLIVMGTEGQGGHGFLGRVVERVVRLGPCPVLTVRRENADLVPEASQAASTFV